MRVFYFGCGPHRGGHYWFSSPEVDSREMSRIRQSFPWKTGREDSGFCARSESHGEVSEGQALLHRFEHHTVIAYWDRSMDERPGSNSLFVAESGEIGFEELLLAAKEVFPWVFARQKFEIVLIG